MTPAPLKAEVLVALGNSTSRIDHLLYQGTDLNFFSFQNFLPASKNSLKSGSIQNKECAAILFKNLSKDARRLSIKSNDVALCSWAVLSPDIFTFVAPEIYLVCTKI